MSRMQYYEKDQFIKKLVITESLFKKYSAQLVKDGYVFVTDGETGKRIYSDKDITTFEQITELKKTMTLEQAIKLVVKGNVVTSYNSVTPEILDSKLDMILEQQVITNSRLEALEKENKAFKEELTKVNEELEQHKAIANDRDSKLLEAIRGIQETNKALIETAVTIKKPWWKFWSKQ
ncbi:DUF3967 domain-containing protein [Bacillus sp. AFS088145]|uniref:DUF3967 domain-containing protein n=1 Tax=Bacillus sp. AFS088145 TaxID=2033514 RepID=UPI000BF5E57C|nr:DUF3967 domain-containing protein [Bacillus sp. AFS088145]PFH81623.1 hypothetical protein COI44_22875 [Bacillus sp. AFS088145]